MTGKFWGMNQGFEKSSWIFFQGATVPSKFIYYWLTMISMEQKLRKTFPAYFHFSYGWL